MFLEIEKKGREPLVFHREIPVGKLVRQELETILVGSVRIQGQVLPARDGFLLRGRLQASTQIPCSRCLEPYIFSLETEVIRIYVSGQEPGAEIPAGERKLPADEIPLARFDGRRIDLLGLAEEQVFLDLPLKPVCREECRGLCPQCGVNRNLMSCLCRSERIDHWFGALGNLLNRS